MADIIIGTAGHIDHGKSTLVKALTGIETDTTKEEKQRGLSINLGFAYLDLPNGKRVGIVDVPGHEKFIKNMVAGLPGIDLVMLVIDAAEGIMPQTQEHIDILSLLGVQHYLIVLSKISQVDQELKELVIQDIKEQLHDTPLASTPIIETDAVEGIGLTEVIDYIQLVSEKEENNYQDGAGRLNVDRVFTVKGIGTVVTGTLLEGQFTIKDELTIFPSQTKTKVRNIQVHEVNQEIARKGQRVAINLANISKESISRGDVLTNVPGQLKLTWMLDAEVTCLGHIVHGLKLWQRVRVLIGTREIFARVVPLGMDVIEPGKTGFVQLRLEEQLTVKANDRFIIRDYSPVITVGGGKVLDALPTKHRRFKEEILDSLKVKSQGSLEQLLSDYIIHQEVDTYTSQELADQLGIELDLVSKAIEKLLHEQTLITVAKNQFIHKSRLEHMMIQLTDLLDRYHKQNRLKRGIPIAEIRSKLKEMFSLKQTDDFLAVLANRNLIKIENHFVSLKDFEVVFNKYQLQAQQLIEDETEKAGFNLTKVSSLNNLDENVEEVLPAIDGEKVLIISHDFVIARSYYEQGIKLIEAFVEQRGELTLADFRDLTHSNRKSALAILEYMDKTGITKRVGDRRKLVSR